MKTGAAFLALAPLLLAGCTGARWGAVVDNDAFAPGGNDHDYSHGMRVELNRSLASAHRAEDALFWVLSHLQVVRPSRDDPRQIAGAQTWALRQHVYTPKNISASEFLRDDRPYAGWLELRTVRTETWLDADASRRHDRLGRLSLGLGTTGPLSLAREVQTLVHEVIDQPTPEGWDHQVSGELTGQLESLGRWRIAYGELSDDFEADLAFDGDWRLGNFDTSAGLALHGRIGWQLPRAEGLWTEGAWQDPTQSAWVYMTLGGRATAYDATLDGALFDDDPGYDRDPWTGFVEVGGVLLWRNFALGYAMNLPSRPFDDPDRAPRYGRLTVGFVSLW